MKRKRGKISLYYSHDINEYIKTLRQRARRIKGVKLSSYKMVYKNGTFPFLRIASREIKSEDPILFITAGIHGEETAGPLTILNQLGEIFRYAKKNKIKLIIYPLCNPSGFSQMTRYNIDESEGDLGNNDFLRYEMADGTFLDDIKNSNNYKAWHWSSDISKNLPLETKTMHRLLKKEPLLQVKALLDIHQDYISDSIPAAYHYSFGKLSVYSKIINGVKNIVPLYKNKLIDAGFCEVDTNGDRSQCLEKAMMSDKNGFIVRHDGTLPDLFYRFGVPYSVTIETMGSTSLQEAMKVNMIWIKGLIDLITYERTKKYESTK
ncbi:MAG TPA: succinylglutamate desuccinylase/aspartoacylase family protein [Candidatus Magasanikbacteria bacterium]|nr:succinylglutamate desuccinylase/aspartoacylase family protein [Candidatus Magasanikbacteria bacterium]